MTDSGILLIDKSAGLSSAQVLNRLKYNLKIKKIGHAGTLDPFATGLLVCLVGKATKLASLAEGGTKVYSGEIQFGLVTDTDDITGNVVSRSDIIPDEAAVVAAAVEFVGLLDQVPPAVSAIHINGERAYVRVRRGESVVIPTRQVRIESFVIRKQSASNYWFEVRCGKGTYIRALARDLGEKLGMGATLAALRREYSAPFSVTDACSMEAATLAHIISGNLLSKEEVSCRA